MTSSGQAIATAMLGGPGSLVSAAKHLISSCPVCSV